MAEKHGILPESKIERSLISLWFNFTSITLLMAFAMILIVEGLNKALIMAGKEIESRKKTEEELKASEAFRKRAFESSRVPIVIMDSITFEYLDCNQAAISIYGFTNKEEVIGKNPMSVSPRFQYNNLPSSEMAKLYIQQALASGAVEFEWRHQRLKR
ncbi:MAG: PAS domain S-box protein [Bacteroidales bacterium]|nr:PAS domain S-box protein [Bacteroidales bacterium]